MVLAAREYMDPPAAGDTALRASVALVPFTEPEEVAPLAAAHARQAFQPLVGPVKREIQPRAPEVTQARVVLLHHGHVLSLAAWQRLDQDIEPV